MTQTANKPSLREAIAETCAEHRDGIVDLKPAVIAAVILAVRDYLLPEEEPLNEEEISDLVIWSRHRQRERLRDILTAEAERAGSGE